MKMDIGDFRAPEGKKVHLSKWPTRVRRFYSSKKDYEKQLAAQIARLDAQQQLLYASDQHAVLVIFQAMDAAGKDGMIRHVLSGINPQGCQVSSFKHPSAAELQHDFLWRSNQELPERGRIGIFNRSYYEDVLIVRVHPEILQGEGLADPPREGEKLWRLRFHSINAQEAHLSRNGTRIVKFFLHLSKEEQRKRFLARIDEPEKNWKFSTGDIEERKFWKDYMHAYEQAIAATTSREAPWYIVPADDKENARLIVSQVLAETLEGLKMSYPQTSPERARELRRIRRQLSR